MPAGDVPLEVRFSDKLGIFAMGCKAEIIGNFVRTAALLREVNRGTRSLEK